MNEELRQRHIRREPIRIASDDLVHTFRLASKWQLTRPRQRRSTALSRYAIRSTIFGNVGTSQVVFESTDEAFDEPVLLQHGLLPCRRSVDRKGRAGPGEAHLAAG